MPEKQHIDYAKNILIASKYRRQKYTTLVHAEDPERILAPNQCIMTASYSDISPA
jgi:hypothetical protein